MGSGDRLANFVGWYAFAASALAAGLIARQLGGGPRTQLAAGLLSLAGVGGCAFYGVDLLLLMPAMAYIQVWNRRNPLS